MNPPRDDGARTAGDTVRIRGLAAPWRPGISGNPSGGSISALGLAAEIRRRTKNGFELVSFFMSILEGRPIHRPGRRPLTPNIDHQMAAASWLTDRAFGKAKEIIEIAGEPSPAQRLELLRKLSDEDRHRLREILMRALNGAAAPGSDAPDDMPALASPPLLEEADSPPPDTTI
jgi:hypothetical protein